MRLGLLSLWLHLATHAMMQCSDTQCHLANCPELPASNPGFNSSCEQCLAEMEMERSFSPEAGDIRRFHYPEARLIMDSSVGLGPLNL